MRNAPITRSRETIVETDAQQTTRPAVAVVGAGNFVFDLLLDLLELVFRACGGEGNRE